MKRKGSSPTRGVLRLVFGFIFVFLPISTVYAHWTAISAPGAELSFNDVRLVSDEGGGVASAYGDLIVEAAAVKYEWNTIYYSIFWEILIICPDWER